MEYILRVSDLCKMFKVNRRTIDRWEENRGFPKRKALGERSIGWLADEVDDWVRSLPIKTLQSKSSSHTPKVSEVKMKGITPMKAMKNSNKNKDILSNHKNTLFEADEFNHAQNKSENNSTEIG